MIEILVYSGTTREQSPIEKEALHETGNVVSARVVDLGLKLYLGNKQHMRNKDLTQ